MTIGWAAASIVRPKWRHGLRTTKAIDRPKSIRSGAEIKDVTWHTPRHTCASRLAMGGVDLKTVQELMGHKTIAMTARYAHLAPTHKLQVLATLVRPVVSFGTKWLQIGYDGQNVTHGQEG